MPEISGKAFEVVDQLSQPTLESLVVPGPGVAAIPFLKKKAWNNAPTVFITLSLKQDNSTIQAATLSSLGQLGDITFAANRFFSAIEDDTKIRISSFDLSKLLFDSSLVSQIIDWEQLDLTFILDDEELSQEEYISAGGSEFCLKANILPSSFNSCRINISLIPRSPEQVIEQACPIPHIPSFILKTKELVICPNTKAKWGLGFLVLLVKGTPGNDLGNIDQAAMRQAVHGLLRQAILSKSYKKLNTFQQAWNELASNGGTTPKKTLDWPEFTDADTTKEGESSGES